MFESVQIFIDKNIEKIYYLAGEYAKVFGVAALILLFGLLVSILVYKTIMFLFRKFNIVNLIDKLTMVSIYKKDQQVNEDQIRKISDNIKIDVITAKSMAYYVFLISFRYSIVYIGITEVEQFLDSIVLYLPNLFIAVVIGFFGIRFANFIYDVIYYPLDMSGQKNAEIIAMGGKIIILFFTLMVVLGKIGIATEITNIILVGFVAMLAISGGLAFGLGGKELAKEILESFTQNQGKKDCIVEEKKEEIQKK